MKLYNQLEQLVTDAVDRYIDSLDRVKYPDVCGCRQCRLDVVCYALNQMKPRYIVSERGFTHNESGQTIQQQADIIAHIAVGVERVSRTKRPHHCLIETEFVEHGPCFLFPVITGRIIDGKRFEPIPTAEIELRIDDIVAEMKDVAWTNPLSIPAQAEGRYSFWPAPRAASGEHQHRVFDLDLYIGSGDFERVHHFFQLELTASETITETPKATREIPDLYLFHRV